MSKKPAVVVAVFIAAAAILIVTGILMAANKPEKSIKWYTDFNKASKDARKYAKPMLVDFYTDWCGWCKKLDSETYTDSRVIDASRKFVNVKVNGDKIPELVQKYKIEGYPTIIFLNSKSKEISRVVGYRNADDFLNAMNEAVKKSK